MSLAIPRPMQERASVVLPTITCSSCSAPIPLNALGEHLCRPGSASAGGGGKSMPHGSSRLAERSAPRQVPVPSKLTIPSADASRNAGQSSSYHSDPSPPFARPYASSPSGSNSSSPTFQYQRSLQAPSPAYGDPSAARTPSPTNPFFPQNRSPQRNASNGSAYPSEFPLPPGVQEMPDMTSGGHAGMAGVGRRAFAAAAWGVRAGVALANGAGSRQGSGHEPPAQSAPNNHHHQSQQQHTRAPSRDPSPPIARVTSPMTIESPILTRPTYPSQSRSASPAERQSPLLPQVPLANRARAGTISAGSPNPQRQNSDPPSHRGRQASVESSVSAQTTSQAETGDSISQLLKARQGEQGQSKQSSSGRPFFDRYKAMVASSASSSDGSSPALGIGNRSSKGSPEITQSPEETSFRVEQEDDEVSNLPWATPLGDAPEILQKTKVPPTSKQQSSASQLGRHKTANSSSSQSPGSSARSRLLSEPSDEVVTPSQSWEGIAEHRSSEAFRRDAAKGSSNVGLGFGMEDRDHLEQINEDDEERDQVSFGGLAPRMKPSTSGSSLSTDATSNPYRTHSRAQTAPEYHSSKRPDLSRTPSSSTTTAAGTSVRRPKICAKCNETVGGAKRFVERDGVVLCERDWKKLYLPSCRRCRQPIEKSAVSSSDGQLKGKWHRACFTCTKCDKGFDGDDFYVLDGRPWCQYHYHEENGTLCSAPSCRQPIEGKCFITPGPSPERFHPGHLRCDHRGGLGCKDKMEEYYQVGRGRYCESHVSEALRKEGGNGATNRAEKRRTRMIDLGGGAGSSLR